MRASRLAGRDSRGGERTGGRRGFSATRPPDQRAPADHPLQPIREMTDEVLRQPRAGSPGSTPRPAGRESPEVFGRLETVGLLRQTQHRGRERVGWTLTFTVAVYNLVRPRTLRAAAA